MAQTQINTRQLDFLALNSIKRDEKFTLFGISLFFCTILGFFLLSLAPSYASSAAPKRIVALGDSLTSGYGLESGYSFPAQLEILLKEQGINVVIDNAGVSGDTTAGGLSRTEWAIDGDITPSLVIIALGANDMLRGLPIKETKSNLSEIIKIVQKRKIPILLIGMKAPLNYPSPFIKEFEGVYEELADEFDIPLYPFFLEGVALKSHLNQADGIHPNVEGIKIIAQNILPLVKESLE